MTDIRVRELDRVDSPAANEILQVILGLDRDALRIEGTGEGRRVPAALDLGDLGGGKSDHVVVAVFAEENVEVVEVPARGAQDHQSSRHDFLLSRGPI